MPEATSHELKVEDLITGYGKKQVLNGVSIDVHKGEIVGVIGHNGAGKSTLLKAIFGLLPIWQGQIIFQRVLLNSREPGTMLGHGVAYVPQGNRVFHDLTVRENLEVASTRAPDKSRNKEGIERALYIFPALKPRLAQRAATLSGGEQQMLALANALTLFPRFLLLDEPSLGLAPRLLTETFEQIKQISEDLGASVLIVEQKVREVLKIAGRIYVIRGGRVSFSSPAGCLSTEKLREVLL